MSRDSHNESVLHMLMQQESLKWMHTARYMCRAATFLERSLSAVTPVLRSWLYPASGDSQKSYFVHNVVYEFPTKRCIEIVPASANEIRKPDVFCESVNQTICLLPVLVIWNKPPVTAPLISTLRSKELFVRVFNTYRTPYKTTLVKFCHELTVPDW